MMRLWKISAVLTIKEISWNSPENPPCIDLISVSKPRSFHRTCVIKTGLSDFHIMTVSVLKIHLHKLPPKFISYRDIKSLKIEG